MNTTAGNAVWYTTEFVRERLIIYLKNAGFWLNEPGQVQLSHNDKLVVATKLLSRELIEIRGTVDGSTQTVSIGQHVNSSYFFAETISFLSDVLLMPVNFFSSQPNDGKNRCFCLPDLSSTAKSWKNLNDILPPTDCG